MNYKLPFFILVVGVTALGLIAFSPAIYAAIEPHITIMMDPGQTTNPFVIKDDLNNDVFRINSDGTIFPSPVLYSTMTATQAYLDEIYNSITYEDVTLTYEDAQTGAGIYQWEYTIQAGDLPTQDSMGIFNFDKPIAMVTTISENTGVSTSNCSMGIYYNDESLGGGSGNSIDVGNFVTHGWLDDDEAYGFFDRYLHVGDTIGIKIYNSVPDSCVLQSVYLGSIPRIEINALTLATEGYSGSGFDNPISPTDPFTTGTVMTSPAVYCIWTVGTWDNTGMRVNQVASNSDFQKSFVKGNYWYCDASQGGGAWGVEASTDQHRWFENGNDRTLFTDETDAIRWTYINDGS